MGKGRKNRKLSITFNKRGLILCEGETEANYFNGLISQDINRRKFSSIDVDIYKPTDHSPIGLINHAKTKARQAKRERNEYDFIWVLFDKDGHKGIPDAFEMARTFNPPIMIAFTIPCFEYFVLLHFIQTTKNFAKCDSLISFIKDNDFIPNYKKTSNLFNLLLPNMGTGIENSRWVANTFKDNITRGEKIYELPAYSNIHNLIGHLYSLLD
jgi:hypothetical protein